MDINKNGVQLNFLKSLEINNINNEVGQLHPRTQEFWKEDYIWESLLDFQVSWSRNPQANVKKIINAQDDAARALKSDEKQEKEIELGFVDGLFQLYKLKDVTSKKPDQKLGLQKFYLAIVTDLDHFSFNSFICFRFSTIEDLTDEKEKSFNMHP